MYRLLLPTLLLAQALCLSPAAAEPVQENLPAGSHGSGVEPAPSSGWHGFVRCLEDLPQEKKVKAEAILSDSLGKLNELDSQISVKKNELLSLTYSETADPETLPRLGLDLQRLRSQMRETLARVNLRLRQEAGVQVSATPGGQWRAQ